MREEVVLLDMFASPYGMRVRIALTEKGVQFEGREEDFGQKSHLLLESNPVHKRIPVLIHNGKPVCESLNIVEYIDDVWSHLAPLLPKDPHERARARLWARYTDDKVYLIGKKLIWKAKQEEKTKRKNEFIGGLKTLETELGDKHYFGGESFGFVDVALIPITSWFYSFETCANFSVEAECPKLAAWAERCMQRESVTKSLPDPRKIYAFVTHLNGSRGE